MIITKAWAMPNKKTFDIKPIRAFIEEFLDDGLWIDPFSNDSHFKDRMITNDLNPDIDSDYHLDALEFLKSLQDSSADGVLYDPPYSFRQAKECYQSFGIVPPQGYTKGSHTAAIKNQIARILKPGGKCFSFGWNSGGIGMNRGFKQVKILLVAHGSGKNDTICTYETKTNIEQLTF